MAFSPDKFILLKVTLFIEYYFDIAFNNVVEICRITFFYVIIKVLVMFRCKEL